MVNPWLTIIGIGEDGKKGLSLASQKALVEAKYIIGAPRHLELCEIETSNDQARITSYPVPFSVEPILAHRGESTVMLVSGDPFWYGGGATITKNLETSEWVSYPSASTFSWIANALGWSLENTECVGLHAREYTSIRARLQNNGQWIILLRNGQEVHKFALWLCEIGFSQSALTICEAVGGERARFREAIAEHIPYDDIAHPVAIALRLQGQGYSLSSGLRDEEFIHQGQITKQKIRAMALSSLAPREGERLWDLGAGSGSLAIEWLLSGQSTSAHAVEIRDDRVALIQENAQKFGVSARLTVHKAAIEGALEHLPMPDAVFLGGGGNIEIIERIWKTIPKNTRLVAHSVTLETSTALQMACARFGGRLTKVEISQAEALGGFTAWKAAYPIIEWQVEK